MEYIPSYRDQLYDDLYLEHHGILGQKWGVRRYQNEDGTRTAAGRRREKKYSETFNKAAKKASKFSRYAREEAENYTNNRRKYLKNTREYEQEEYDSSRARKIMDENVRISKRQAKRYEKLAEKYMNIDYDSISKKDYKEAKKFLKNAFFTDANSAWFANTNYEDHD